MTPLQKLKTVCRQMSRRYVKQGLLTLQPCEVCGEPKVERHHEDYRFPEDVVWLCARHHRALHDARKASQLAGA
jgi:hypothetical protein